LVKTQAGAAQKQKKRNFRKRNKMKNKYLTTVIALFISSLVNGQVTIENRQQRNADVIAFSKLESEYQQVQKELMQLELQQKQILALMGQYNEKQKRLLPRIEKLETAYDGNMKKGMTNTVNSENQLLKATMQIEEIQMSFNMQYLQMQSQLQSNNRRYTTISNIMKTKHDTVKNMISNVR
jgi:hypothetical protein